MFGKVDPVPNGDLWTSEGPKPLSFHYTDWDGAGQVRNGGCKAPVESCEAACIYEREAERIANVNLIFFCENCTYLEKTY